MKFSTGKRNVRFGKAFLVLSVILLLTMACLAKWNLAVKAQGNVIYVPDDFQKIQDAINNATPGDTIRVANGTYNEDIVIDKPVSLIGESENSTLIYGVEQNYVIQIQTSDANISGFTVKARALLVGSGIIISSSNNITIYSDTIEDGLDGLVVTSTSHDNHIGGNTIMNNSHFGVSFLYSSNNIFSGNTVSNNSVGIAFASSSQNVLSGNTLSNNSLGVSLSQASNNNLFYHNNFINPAQMQSTNTTNFWSNNGEGNYWSSYLGSDSNSDGIGDTPYTFPDLTTIDNYPLMGRFQELAVSSGTLTYSVSLVSNSTVDGLSYEVGQQTGNRLIHIEVGSQGGTAGFCRITIPKNLMGPPYIVLDVGGEITYSTLNTSQEADALLYFTISSANETVTVVSSEVLQLYIQLSNQLAANQTALLGVLGSLNATFLEQLGNYTSISDFLNQLQSNYLALNSSYQQHLSAYSENTQKLQNLIYIFAATTILFLVTTVYLSRHAQTLRKQR